jgi:hypothetical protein
MVVGCVAATQGGGGEARGRPAWCGRQPGRGVGRGPVGVELLCKGEEKRKEKDGPVVPARYWPGTVIVTVLPAWYRSGTAPGPVSLEGQLGTGPEAQAVLPPFFFFFFFCETENAITRVRKLGMT